MDMGQGHASSFLAAFGQTAWRGPRESWKAILGD